MGMLEEIKEDLAERMSGHIDSRCATADEVRIAWLVSEVERLQSAGPGNKKFSDDQIFQALATCNGNGMRAAKLVGCHFVTVYTRAKKLGIKVNGIKNRSPRNDKRFSDNEVRDALKCNDNNARAAARELGCCHSAINSRAKKLGIKPSGKKGRTKTP